MKTSNTLDKPKICNNREEAPKTAEVHDQLENALRELFFVEHPEFDKNGTNIEPKVKAFLSQHKHDDAWIYYHWRNALVHTLNEKLYFQLRTARNRNIITGKQQQNYRNAVVAIAGLSVGSTILSSLVISGGPKKIKIADYDTIEISNLNRIKANLLDVGKNKCHTAAITTWELDPFAELAVWDQGISKDTVKEFILGEPKIDVFVDEMDVLPLKIQIRKICRENNIPVIMATDNGDSMILDVERFDLEQERPLFHNAVPNIENLPLNDLDYKEWLTLATKIVGPSFLPQKMKESILEIGKTIAAVPQLGTTANIAGAAVSYAIRKIANKENMPSGRYVINLETIIAPQTFEK